MTINKTISALISRASAEGWRRRELLNIEDIQNLDRFFLSDQKTVDWANAQPFAPPSCLANGRGGYLLGDYVMIPTIIFGQ